ncbi:hypothetical protein DL766_004879 [Monosporascus sp. MC13-8B]|uniref:Uncharacterized protein n=1 Tax=Monosporascus cannonballus TaxID=155416 RepID=A0ABY0GZT4_9PEZI|nr:hypothetical protein DL762_008581 [Monosporascus cannonballus]RYP00213.1 hypothetical protein DL763_000982 [Monosporascus cannonballus]RYP30401.1 hypothetical protein DL766_004879 [Monosporascus sp. MC13-8B]
MDLAVDALRALHTFWSGQESQQSQGSRHEESAPLAQPNRTTETSAKNISDSTINVEDGALASKDDRSQGAPEALDKNEAPARASVNLSDRDSGSSRTQHPPTDPHTREEDPSPGSSNAPYTTSVGLEMARQGGVILRRNSSPKLPSHESNGDLRAGNRDSSAEFSDNPERLSSESPTRERQVSQRHDIAPGLFSDEEVRNQPDIISADGRLTLPLDGPQLREVMHRIERDRSICFKMRWYVARHVRQQFQESLPLSNQYYRRRVYRNHNFTRGPTRAEQLISLRAKPFNRLDFEATRMQEHFIKNQSGWQERSITQILQRAYEQYRWADVITDGNVDAILITEAGADLRLFANATKMGFPSNAVSSVAHKGSSRASVSEKSSGGLLIPSVAGSGQYTSEEITQQIRQDTTKEQPGRQRVGTEGIEIPPQGATGNDDEIAKLRAEIRELKAEVERGRVFREKFVEEQRATQEALMAEMRMMLEASECVRKRKRSSGDGKHLSQRRSRKLRKYVQKLKELGVQAGSSSSVEDPSSVSE